MTFALLKVTGINQIEKQMAIDYGDEYKEYQETTSKLIPWFKLNKTKTE
jgi:steroid 5-alpha reductase family enzyme